MDNGGTAKGLTMAEWALWLNGAHGVALLQLGLLGTRQVCVCVIGRPAFGTQHNGATPAHMWATNTLLTGGATVHGPYLMRSNVDGACGPSRRPVGAEVSSRPCRIP